MPVDKKQHTTSSTELPTTSPLSPPQAFHEHLREQIRRAVQAVMEEIMHEELTQFLGAEWGECTNTRRGYRNGSYTRNLATRVGSYRGSSRTTWELRSVPYSGV
jgi:putative transposase